MRLPRSTPVVLLLMGATLAGGCTSGAGGTAAEPAATPAPAPAPPPAAATAEPTIRAPAQVPYEGAFGPADPPRPPLPPMQKPLDASVLAALDVLWERPSPMGPPPIPVAEPQGIRIEGKGPVIQVLPGPPAFPDKIPQRLKTVMPPKVPFSNNVKRLGAGTFRAVAFDQTRNDTKLSKDSMEVEITFTDHEGAEWRIEQVTLAPISPNPVAEPWLGGVVVDTLYHGQTGNGTPAEPLVTCMLCSWGWADIYKNDKRVASSALLHIMLTSDVRGEDFSYACYDCADNPVREVHVIVPPSAYLPSPGGFLHVMWENAEWERDTPERIAGSAPKLGKQVQTIELSAVPYLRWDKEEIQVQAGREYRLIVHNNDPSSFHQFHLHAHPSHGGHGGHGAQDPRHEEGAAAGGTGPLWNPGDEHAHGGGDPPAPRNVFFPLPQGTTWATFVRFEEPGEYEFMCPVSNHYRRGMEGKFVVKSNSPEGGAR